jgi:IPT/TIG domain-containing protein
MRIRLLVPAVLAAIVCVATGSAAARPLAAPTITGFSPKSGWIGTKVTITGTNLAGASVTFNNVGAGTVTVNKWGNALVATVGDETQPCVCPIVVTTPGGMVRSAANFTVAQIRPVVHRVVKPIVNGFRPVRGKPGTHVTVTGNNFAGAIAVKVGGVTVRGFTVPTATKIRLTIPAGARSGRISVKTRLGVGISATRFVVLPHHQL